MGEGGADIDFDIQDVGDEHVAVVAITTPWGEIKVCAEIRIAERIMTISGLHVQSDSGANAFGPARLRRIANAIMNRMDLDAVIIEGAARTTGANPGRTPRLRFTRRRDLASRSGS